ncbi:MAG: hypothetical protein M1816_004693 [Peltula sp. TS41687]|nr:MAG: hypothetical protein M1816_004693 [Peltula sp. TS41687]
MPGKCINVLAAGVAGSVINIFTDFVILLLPMPMVWRLRLPMRQKIAVIGIFATGALVCAISIIRLQAMLAAKEDPDITWGQVPNSITGAIECNIGIACGCMPCLKPLFNRWIPKLKSIASSGSKGNSSSKRNNNGGSSSGGGVQEISARFSHSKKDKTPLSTTYSSNGDIDPRFASGKYLELGEMGTHQTVIGGPPGRSLYPQGSRGPMVSPTPPEAAMVANGRGIVKTVGVDVFAHEKGR